jgi:NDP-sugar pyrophosphorylase family protein
VIILFNGNRGSKMKIDELYDLDHTLAKDYLKQYTYPWEALKGIKEMILQLGPTLTEKGYQEISKDVWVHESAIVAPTAYLGAPCIIGPKTEVRHCAFIRGSALVGANCVVGNSVELKNVILFDNVQTPHYNYVGDSILGYKSHMGAGSITSNVRSDKKLIIVHSQNEIKTGLKKFGAMLGDYVEVGCNSVLNPGTIVGRHTNIYPTSCVRGVIPDHSIYKNNGEIIQKK